MKLRRRRDGQAPPAPRVRSGPAIQVPKVTVTDDGWPRPAVRRHLDYMLTISDRQLERHTDGGPTRGRVDRRRGRCARAARKRNRR